MNILSVSVSVTALGLHLRGVTLALPALHFAPAIGTTVQLGIRLPVTLEMLEKLGGTAFVHARDEAIVAEQRQTSACHGGSLDQHFDPASMLLFDSAGGRLR